jgi:hypothetical protein
MKSLDFDSNIYGGSNDDSEFVFSPGSPVDLSYKSSCLPASSKKCNVSERAGKMLAAESVLIPEIVLLPGPSSYSSATPGTATLY